MDIDETFLPNKIFHCDRNTFVLSGMTLSLIIIAKVVHTFAINLNRQDVPELDEDWHLFCFCNIGGARDTYDGPVWVSSPAPWS